MYKLKIITSTVREERQGIHVAQWVKRQVEKENKFQVELVDIAEWDLPLCKEPNHPSLKQYKYETTKKWSKTIEEADAFIFVLAEYNFGIPAPLKNALDTIYQEWNYKPAAVVSYAGISGGTRSASQLCNVFCSLRMVFIPDGLIFPLYMEHLDKKTGAFEPGERSEISARKMMAELLLWTKALSGLREEKAHPVL